MQHSDFFKHGAGRDLFGEFQPLRRSRRPTRSSSWPLRWPGGSGRRGGFGRRLRRLSGTGPRGTRSGPGASGASPSSRTDWEVLSLTETSLTGTVASVQRSLNGVTNRLGFLNEGMMKRVLWQGELVVRDLTPTIVQNGREALLHDLSEQQGQVFEAVDQQRVATLAAVSAERAAVLDGVRGERIAVLDAIRSERGTVLEALRAERMAMLDAIRDERIATLAAADSMAQRSIDHAAAAAGRLLLWVFVALLALAAILGFQRRADRPLLESRGSTRRLAPFTGRSTAG